MKAGTLFSGIGAPELAGPDIDWRWCAEIDPFACAVLRARFPHVPNLGDVTIETSFSDYEAVKGLKLPKHLVTRIDKWIRSDIHISKNILNVSVNLRAPDAVKTALPLLKGQRQKFDKTIHALHQQALFENAERDHIAQLERWLAQLPPADRSALVVDSAASGLDESASAKRRQWRPHKQPRGVSFQVPAPPSAASLSPASRRAGRRHPHG